MGAKPQQDHARSINGCSLQSQPVQTAARQCSRSSHAATSGLCCTQVYVAVDTHSDGRADTARTFITGLDHPNGVVWHNGSLFVMTATHLVRYDDVDSLALSGQVQKNSDHDRGRVKSALARSTAIRSASVQV
jgi:glucose/arabinose dehydrogenase